MLGDRAPLEHGLGTSKQIRDHLSARLKFFSNKALAFTRDLRGSHAIIIFNKDTLHLRKRRAALKTMHVHTWLFRFINFES